MSIPVIGQVVQLKAGGSCQVQKLLANRRTGEVAVQGSDGGIHLLEDCHLILDPCPTITQQDWANLKETAREIHIPDRLFVEILERVTGIPANQLRARNITYDQWAEILIQIEEAAFALHVCCPLTPAPARDP